jgi:membrane-associated phospholipid phosphatase
MMIINKKVSLLYSIARSVTCIIISILASPASTIAAGGDSIYRFNPKADISITVAGVAGTVVSYPLRNKKPALDSATALSLSPMQLSSFNRDAAMQYDPKADKVSDVFFYSGFAIPMLLAFDAPLRKNALTVSVMYLEAMGIAGTLDGLVGGNVKKLRPYAYNPQVPLKDKLDPNVNGSFYGSHPSFTAAGAFFFAKVYSDYHPSSNMKYVVWPAAGAVTLASAYYRYKGGHHFISDMAVGVGVGTAIGILVPEFHRIKQNNALTWSLFTGDASGITMTWHVGSMQQQGQAMTKQ